MPDISLDNLQIEIGAKATDANRALDDLINKLGRLTTSLGGLNGKNYNDFAVGVKNITTAMQGMKDVKLTKFNTLASGIEKLSKIDTKSVEKAGRALKPLGDSMSALSNTNFDNKNLQSFINSLTKFANSNFQSLSSVNFDGLAQSINTLAVGLSNAPKIQQSIVSMTNAVANLAKSGNNIPIINANLGQFAKEFGAFTSRMAKAPVVSQNTIDFANAIGVLGKAGKNVAVVAGNLNALGIELKKLMTTLSTAPVVSRNLIDMTMALGNLARTGASSGRASTSLAKSLDLYTASTKRASKSTWSLASAFGKMYASYWLIFRAFRQIGKAIDISSDLAEIQNVVDVTFGDMSHKVEQFAETSIEQFGMSELTLKKVASQFQAMGSAMNINGGSIANANKYLNEQTNGYVDLGDSMADVSLTLTKLTADMASFYNVEQDVVSEDLQSIFTGQSKPLRQYGIDLTEVNLKQWAMTQGLNSNIEAMTQAEKVMLRYQYVLAHTGASQNDFSRTANTWANQIRILKQNFEQLGIIIGTTFINMLKPLVQALNGAMSGIIAFAETVSNALGKIFGWKFEVGGGGVTSDLESGAGYADDLSDSMGSASDNAKKLKSYLLGIDELNVIEPQQDTSGGGGSGAGAGAGGGGASGGQWVKGDTIFEDYKSEIDSLYELGDYISQTLSRAMESIDWDSVYQKARGFGKGLADFLNGLISPRLFGNIGKTIANSLNTALEFLNTFGQTFDFYEFGKSIAWGIRDFFDNFDFELLAETLNTWVDGFKDFIKGFLDTITWDSILEGGKDFLGELELDTVAILLGGFVLKHGKDILTSKKLRTLITDKLSGLLKQGNLLSMAGGVAKGTMTGLVIGATVYVGFEFAEDAQEWKRNIDEYGWDEGRVKTAMENTANPYMNGTVTFKTQDIDNFKQDLEDAKTSFNLFFEEFGGKSVAFFDSIGLGLSTFATNISTKFTEWKDNVKLSLDGAKTSFNDWFVEIGGKFSTWYSENVQPWFSVETWEGLWENIKTSAETKWGELVAWWNETALAKWWEENVKPWFNAEDWSDLYSVIQTELEGTWDDVVNWWTTSAIYRWYNDHVKTWFDKEDWTFSGIKDGLKQAWENAVEAVKQVWNKFANWFNSKMSIELPSLEIDGKKIFEGKTIEFIKLPTFATGGFPEDGLFMANHTELVGKFSNGRTAVANNDMITTGIENAVYRGFSMAYSENNREVSLLEELIVAVREGKSITIDGRELVEAYDNRKTRNGYAF